MDKNKADSVYYTLCGQLLEAYRQPGVEDLFAEGMICEKYFAQLCEGYDRLRSRLAVEEDEDIEQILHAGMSIMYEVATRMYF